MNRLINLIKSLVPSRHINKTTKEELKEVIIELIKDKDIKLKELEIQQIKLNH